VRRPRKCCLTSSTNTGGLLIVIGCCPFLSAIRACSCLGVRTPVSSASADWQYSASLPLSVFLFVHDA